MSLDFGITKVKETTVYSGNYTHNVAKMWELAGVYESLYNSNGRRANEILLNLKVGIKKMEKSPEEFKKLNPENGWGDYDSALGFLKEIALACEENPDGKIYISK
jgi:hypothetical protein